MCDLFHLSLHSTHKINQWERIWKPQRKINFQIMNSRVRLRESENILIFAQNAHIVEVPWLLQPQTRHRALSHGYSIFLLFIKMYRRNSVKKSWMQSDRIEGKTLATMHWLPFLIWMQFAGRRSDCKFSDLFASCIWLIVYGRCQLPSSITSCQKVSDHYALSTRTPFSHSIVPIET